MKITLYTITDCPFCRQEKEYLKSNNMSFEEKNLETNRDFLTEMLSVSNNFSGVPVTKIEKDDGQVSVLKGFTKEEFDKVLGFAPVMQAQQQPEPTSPPGPQPTPPPPPSPTPPPPPAPEPEMPSTPIEEPTPPPPPPAPEPPKEPEVPPAPPSPTPEEPPVAPQPTNTQPPKQDEALNAILNNLQAKASEPSSLPNIPNFPSK